jgi:hypothetical protein
VNWGPGLLDQLPALLASEHCHPACTHAAPTSGSLPMHICLPSRMHALLFESEMQASVLSGARGHSTGLVG